MDSIAEIKSRLHFYIAETDDVEKLSKLNNYVKALLEKEDKIIAYTPEGLGLSHADYKKEIDKAITEADKGDVISQEEMEKDL